VPGAVAGAPFGNLFHVLVPEPARATTFAAFAEHSNVTFKVESKDVIGAVCCSVLQCVVVCCSVLLQRIAACCSVLQRVAARAMTFDAVAEHANV